MIRQDRVTVDGELAHLGQKADPQTARIEVDGIPLPVQPDLVYYLLYKPTGVVTTASDPEGRPTVVDLVPAEPRVVPAGRLDADSEGLLILSNDGEFINRVTHPSFGVTKTYLARVSGSPGPRALQRLIDGIELDDGPAAALRAKLIDSFGPESLVEVVMGEGRNREVRRLMAAIGHPVVALVRTAVGSVKDQQLGVGTWRHLDVTEVRMLFGDLVDDPDDVVDVIAIDGPGGVGKTTTARAVASATGRAHLDTGAMYRAATLAVLDEGVPLDDLTAVIAAVAACDIGFEEGVTYLNGVDVSESIRSTAVDDAVSAVSAVADVRSRLVELQRAWVRSHGPSVVEGRDIGTVVFADTAIKVFLTADPAVRAARRAQDKRASPGDHVAEQLARRDRLDSSREISPLRPAPDAHTIDTTDLSPDEVATRVVNLASDAGPGSEEL
jgi:23S rRNA pseudouridine2605 synthase